VKCVIRCKLYFTLMNLLISSSLNASTRPKGTIKQSVP